MACTSSTTDVANNSPAASPSPSPSASPSPSPSPTTEPTSNPTPGSGSLAITSLPFHNGEVGIGYLAVTLGASGGTAPYTWSVSGGTFPPGLTLSSEGVISGVNTQAGQFNFTVKVADSAGGSATSTGSFGVFPAMKVTQPCANQCIVGAGCTRCGGFGTISGGLGPYTFKVVGGAVPGAMTLNGLTLKGGFPQSPLGAFNLSVQVTDQFTATATVNASWYVYNPATLNAGGDCLDTQTGVCTASGWSYAGGNGAVDPQVTVVAINPYCPDGCFYPDPKGQLPPGWSATAKGGNITITAGPPSSCNEYAAVLTLQLRDASKCPTTFASNQADLIVVVANNNQC